MTVISQGGLPDPQYYDLYYDLCDKSSQHPQWRILFKKTFFLYVIILLENIFSGMMNPDVFSRKIKNPCSFAGGNS